MSKRAGSSKGGDHPSEKKLKISHTVSKDDAPTLRYKTGSGVVLVCGQGDTGQLGLGPDVLERKSFTLVPNLENIVQVAVGGMHSMCLAEDGKVYTWGCNDEGALGRDAEGNSECEPQAIELPKKAVQISAGDSHSAALLEDGTVCAWGSFRDSHGSMGLRGEGIEKVPVQLADVRGIVKISSGADHFVMLTSRGTVLTTGCPEQGQLGRVPQRSASRNARRGMSFLETPRQVPVRRKRIHDVFTGVYNTFLADKDSVLGFGLNNYSQLGETEEVESNSDNLCFFEPHFIRSLSGKKWSMLASGQHHSLALNAEGKIFSFGRHDYGRLGLNVSETVTEPTPIPSLQDKTIKFEACGNCVSFAIDSEGSLYGWGMGDGYQLGNGSDEDILEPTKIEGKQLINYSVLQVASGGQHTIILAKRK